MRRFIGAFALAIALVAPAHAQDEEEAAGADTAALAAQMIADARAEGVFEAVPNERFVLVRHTASGMVCRLSPATTNRIAIFPQAARGEDVACESLRNGEVMRLYATRYSFETTLDQQIAGATDAIREHYYSVHPLPEPSAASTEGGPRTATARFAAATQSGERFYTRVSVAQFGPWTIKMRFTAPMRGERDIERAERRAETVWGYAMRNMTARRRR